MLFTALAVRKGLTAYTTLWLSLHGQPNTLYNSDKDNGAKLLILLLLTKILFN